MGIWTYFKERLHLIIGGFILGFALGYLRAVYLEPAELAESARLILASQIGCGFSLLALFLKNYSDFRQRVIKKAEGIRAAEVGGSESS